MLRLSAPPSVLPDISLISGEIGRPLEFRQSSIVGKAPASKLPISPPVGYDIHTSHVSSAVSGTPLIRPPALVPRLSRVTSLSATVSHKRRRQDGGNANANRQRWRLAGALLQNSPFSPCGRRWPREARSDEGCSRKLRRMCESRSLVGRTEGGNVERSVVKFGMTISADGRS